MPATKRKFDIIDLTDSEDTPNAPDVLKNSLRGKRAPAAKKARATKADDDSEGEPEVEPKP
jgi:hypothetical protein